MAHISVLLQEVLDGLDTHDGDTVVDGTFNVGGHSFALCELHKDLTIIGIDADANALERAKERGSLPNGCHLKLWEGNFRNLDAALASFDISKVDRIILDLGLSSDQLELSGRGFSFKRDEPLLMTFAASPKPGDLTGWEIVNRFDEEEIKKILYQYGEERFAPKIARAIVAAREKKPIERSGELAEIITQAVPGFYAHRKTHPATKTFQALRIAVNDELGALSEGLEKGFSNLAVGGRMAVIAFHSLEDRIVKRFMREKVAQGYGKAITKKPIIPSDKEAGENPRSRSAKLRIIEKTAIQKITEDEYDNDSH